MPVAGAGPRCRLAPYGLGAQRARRETALLNGLRSQSSEGRQKIKVTIVTESEHRELARIAAAYGLAVERSSRLSGGAENLTYLLKTTRRLVVATILLKKSETAAGLYVDYLMSLHANGFPVPVLLARCDGGYTSRYGARPALLFDYVEGHQYKVLPSRFLPQVGTTLAKLHASNSLQCELPPCLRLSFEDIEDIGPKVDREFVRWARHWHEQVEYIVGLPVSMVATHGDLFVDNLLVDAQGRVLFIDWEDGARDGRWVDLSTALLGLCTFEKFQPARAHALLGAYVRDACQEIDSVALRDATVYAAVYAAVHRYRRQSQRSIRPGQGRSYRALQPVVDSLMSDWNISNNWWL